MMNKLKSKAGESIAEVLISSLIVSLAFIMVFTMLNASRNIIEISIERQQSYYTQRNEFEEKSSIVEENGTVIVNSTGSNNITTIVGDTISVNIQKKQINESKETLIQFERSE